MTDFSEFTAVIMAGGEGKRLYPITESRPKPMVPVGNIPCMGRIIELLASHGIKKAVVTTCYMPEMIENAFGSEYNGVSLIYSREEKPLGTAGSVKLAEEHLSDTFVVISGDAVCETDITSAINFHRQREADVTFVLSQISDPTQYGIVMTSDSGKITQFYEKPLWNRVFSDRANTGIYIINKSVMSLCPENKFFDFSKDLFPLMLEKGMPLYAMNDPAFWCDIGDVAMLLSTNLRYMNDSVFGDGCRMGESCEIKGSLFFDNVTLGNNCRAEAAIICENVTVGNNVSFGKGCVIGADCVIGDNVNIPPNARIKRYSRVDGDCPEHKSFAEKCLAMSCRGVFIGDERDFDDEFCYAIGRALALSAEQGKCAVCCDAYNDKIKEKILRGMSSEASICYDFGHAFDAMASFAAIHLNTKILACITGTGKKSINLYDSDGLYPTGKFEKNFFSALKEDITEFKKSRPPVIYSELWRLYVNSLSKILPSDAGKMRIAFNSSPPARALREAFALNNGIVADKARADIYVEIDGSGRELRFTQGNLSVDQWHAAAIIARNELQNGTRRIVLPFSSPYSFENIAEETGGKLDYYSFCPSDESESVMRASVRSYLWMADSANAAARLITILAHNALDEISESIPQFYRREIEVDVGGDERKTRLLSRLASQKNSLSDDGILLNYGEEGRIRVVPDRRRLVHIYADAADSEHASELLELSKKTIEKLMSDE